MGAKTVIVGFSDGAPGLSVRPSIASSLSLGLSAASIVSHAGIRGPLPVSHVVTAIPGPLGFSVGAYDTGSFSLLGRIDDLRVTAGAARDVSIVPTAPFPAGT